MSPRLLLLLFLGTCVRTQDQNDGMECSGSSESDGTCKPLETEWWDELWSIGEMWELFGCDEIFASARPVHNQSTWMLMRGVYHGVVGPNASSISPLSYESGFPPPIEAKQAGPKGRGVFAAGTVKKGDMVWTAKRNRAKWGDGPSYRKFLISIPTDLACDVLQWAYVQSFSDEENDYESDLLICADLDEGSFMNSASYDEEPNVGCTPSPEEKCKDNMYALRDIEVGEELLCNYGDFAVPHGWQSFDL
mmetsp:Transcript_18066/g.26497  ORF Transcript_18066/g.26497 Transcript_18066/m.26497 type:complete len:249 (-) Transcript_18066:131-877(-)|eukprot:CAMPEP_0195509984 /NCGR_PEP_ID=MMETSP0794_2-20130614/2763_1 /TAXON_ID=515487 /ORGANISM="Stephanopyxis turris, Strain CCMP 815" /LENGTH=248 /DNA_ID=CAMNT_0040637325 /DNA_START=105 /DNA_END=851 /DNA_ORIENTATION=+